MTWTMMGSRHQSATSTDCAYYPLIDEQDAATIDDVEQLTGEQTKGWLLCLLKNNI